jgi:hypothetical protein
MSNRFLIALTSGNVIQRNAVTEFIRAKGWKVWHWIEDLWLLTDVPPEVSPRTLWDDLIQAPTLKVAKGLVMRLDSEMKYWGGNDPESWEWMKQNWGPSDFPQTFAEPKPSESTVASGEST